MFQDRHPYCYVSRTLNKPEINYSTTPKELSIVWSVKKLRQILLGKKFKIQTDHQALKQLFNVKDPSSRSLRQRLCLEEYQYEIEYVKGKDKKADDALSRVLPVQDFKTEERKHILGDVERQLEYVFLAKVEQGIDKPATSKHPETQIRNDDQLLKSVEVYEQVDSPAGYRESVETPENVVQQDWNPKLISEYYKWLKNKIKDRTKWKPNAERRL